MSLDADLRGKTHYISKRFVTILLLEYVLVSGSTMWQLLITLFPLSRQNIEEMRLYQGVEVLKTTRYEGGN